MANTPARIGQTVATFCLVAAIASCGGPGSDDDESIARVGEPICAGGETVKGVDVSYYQGKIDWTAAKAWGLGFAVARVAYGSGFVDPKFHRNWHAIKDVGLVRGAYQFFVASQNPIEQADLMLQTIDAEGGSEPDDLPPMIDLESKEGQKPAVIIKRLHQWLEHVEDVIGRPPMIYTSPGFWGAIGSPSGFEHYPLWIAHWGVDCPTVPKASWSDFVIWQEGPFEVDGFAHKVDGDYFNGSMDDLLAFASSGGGTRSTSSGAGSGGGEGGGRSLTGSGGGEQNVGGNEAVEAPTSHAEANGESGCSVSRGAGAPTEAPWFVALALGLATLYRRLSTLSPRRRR